MSGAGAPRRAPPPGEPGAAEQVARARVVVVTGQSGAGKSTALNTLEDLGFFCVDNLPTPVIGATLAACEADAVTEVALGLDVRGRSFLDDISRQLDDVAKSHQLSVVFLDASDEALLRRFSGTRRPHPLSHDDLQRPSVALLDGVHAERERLAPLRARASLVVDTTKLSVHELRRRIVHQFGPGAGAAPRLHVRFVSFGFKYGAPVDADLMFDVRFVKNPYFVPELKEKSGLEPEVRAFVLEDDATRGLLRHLEALLEYCLPRYEEEGKSYLTVAIGCTGGRHRSVAITEKLASRLQELTELRIDVAHRDVQRVVDERRDQEAEIASVRPPPVKSLGEES